MQVHDVRGGGRVEGLGSEASSPGEVTAGTGTGTVPLPPARMHNKQTLHYSTKTTQSKRKFYTYQ